MVREHLTIGRVADRALSILVALASVAVIAMAVDRYWPDGMPNGTQRPSPTQPPLSVPTEPVSVRGMQTTGSTESGVVLIEFSDFECPYCARFAREIWPAIHAEYVATGLLTSAFAHAPDLAKHPRALHGAAAAECAGVRGKFWPMKTLLFENADGLHDDALRTYARRVGLDIADFEQCVKGVGPDSVGVQLARNAKLGIRGTPMFMIGLGGADGVDVKEVIAGAQPIEEFRAAIDRVRGTIQ